MATYAAFKHVELYNVGKAKKRVLKPPGGGSSDIFGAANGSAASTPRSAPASKNHMVSNIFGAPQNRNGDTRRNTTADSHNRLFGEVERIQAQPGRVKSNIPFGNGDATDAPTSANGSNGHSKAAAAVSSNGNGNGVASIVHAENGNGNGNGHHHHHHANGNGLNGNAGGARANGGGSDHHQNGNGTKHDGGNPVTGQGYRGGDSHSTAPTLNGSKQVINKNRIPPGGFSSGLW